MERAYQKCVQSNRSDLLVKRPPAIPQEGLQRQRILVLFDQHFFRTPHLQRTRECHGHLPPREIAFEHLEVVSLMP